MSTFYVVLHTLQVSICVDDVDIAGDIVAEVATWFNLTNLSSTAHFPTLMDNLQSLLAKVRAVN